MGSSVSPGHGDGMKQVAALALVLLLAAVPAWSDNQSQSLPASVSSRIATISVNLSALGPTIPTNFIGLSAENQDLINGYYQGTTGHASSFIALVNLLGSHGVLRIGGSTADESTPPALTSQIATNLASFVGGLGANWTTIYGLDLFAANSGVAVTQAGYLATALGVTKVTFQMGNEPVTSGNFTLGSYETAWNSYYTAIIGAVSSARFAAWDDYSLGSTQAVIAALTPGLSGMSYVTQHYYTTNGASATEPQMLGLLQGMTFSTNIPWAGAVPTRLTETNSMNTRGVAGMSDRLMAATFILNESIELAAGGWNGINVHECYTLSGAACVYNPVIQQPDLNFAPGPIFYGMYLFAQIEGDQIAQSAVSGNGSNVDEIAVAGSGGKAIILVSNNDPYSPVSVTPNESVTWSTASVLLLAASDNLGCTSAQPVLGGQPIGESGVWRGFPSTISNGQAVVIPPCGAALIQIQ